MILAKIRKQPCAACGSRPVDAAHIKSKGSGGSSQGWNLLPLCRDDHRRQHSVGWRRFIESNPTVMEALLEKGWEFEMCNGRFVMTNERGK